MPPTSEAEGEPDEIGPKADIDTHAAWPADRNWPTLSRIGPPRRRVGAARRDLRPDDSPTTSEGENAPWRLRSGVHDAAAAGAGFAFGQHL